MVRSAFFACLMFLALAGTASGQAFLTVHNNTDATLEVFIVSRFASQDMARPTTVPPVSAVRFAVEMGLFELIVEAPKVGGDVGFRRNISFLKSGEHEVEIFPADFGTTFLADKGGPPADGCDALPGKWAWFVNGEVTINPDGTHQQGAITGTWTCAGNEVGMSWSHGYVDDLVLSADGRSLSGVGHAKDPAGPQGYAVSGTKLQ